MWGFCLGWSWWRCLWGGGVGWEEEEGLVEVAGRRSGGGWSPTAVEDCVGCNQMSEGSLKSSRHVDGYISCSVSLYLLQSAWNLVTYLGRDPDKLTWTSRITYPLRWHEIWAHGSHHGLSGGSHHGLWSRHRGSQPRVRPVGISRPRVHPSLPVAATDLEFPDLESGPHWYQRS